MAHAFETIEQYEELAKQCDVQASFATSPAERDSPNKQLRSVIWLDSGRHTRRVRRTHRTPIEPDKLV